MDYASVTDSIPVIRFRAPTTALTSLLTFGKLSVTFLNVTLSVLTFPNSCTKLYKAPTFDPDQS